MDTYKIDPKLVNNSFTLGELDNCLVVLMDNAIIPWFVLIPKDEAKELFHLDNNEQISMLKGIKAISRFARQMFEFKDLQVGAVSNSIGQLHLHVVAKGVKAVEESGIDYNKQGYPTYNQDEVDTITDALAVMYKGDFKRA